MSRVPPHVWPHCEHCPSVTALDLSLAASGIVTPTRSIETFKTKTRGEERLSQISEHVWALTVKLKVDLVMLEGYAYARANQAHQIGELGGVIRLMLWEFGVPYIVVPPSTVKKFATGKGNAGKPEVLKAAWERLGYEGTDDNQADALWLWTMGLEMLGHPTAVIPSVHRSAVDKLELPRDLDARWR